MSVAAAPGFSTVSPFARLAAVDAAAMAARCGDDVIRLRPSWAAVIAATRFARQARWMFGNDAATLECLEPQPKRWLTQRGSDDPVQVHFDLAHWGSAYARCDGRAREINVFAADGSVIAAVRLDDVEASLDELLWLLVDDDQATRAPHIAAAPPHRCALRPGDALAPEALHQMFRAACDAQLPLRLVLENAGGSVAWSPRDPVVREFGDTLELLTTLGRVTLGDRYAGAWNLRLGGTPGSDQTLEAYGAGGTWLTVSLAQPATLERLAWRGICTTLPQR